MFPAIFEAKVIAFDLHGVIDHNPRFFKGLLKLLIDAGRTVMIVSGPPEEQIQNELAALRIIRYHHFDDIYSIVDSLQNHKVEMWQDDKGTWWANNEDWWTSKGRICRDIEADVMIDDHIEFKEGFPDGHPTKFILFNYYWKEFFNGQKIK